MKKTGKKSLTARSLNEEQQDKFLELLDTLDEQIAASSHTFSSDFLDQAFSDIRKILDSTIDRTKPRTGEYWFIMLDSNSAPQPAYIYRDRVTVCGDEEDYVKSEIYRFIKRIEMP